MHFFHLHDGSELSPWRVRCIQSVKQIMADKDTYEMVTVPRVEGQSVIRSSEDMRILLLNKNRDAVYIDTDAYLLKRPEFDKPNIPYLAEYTMTNHGTKFPDVYLMASNGASEWFSPEKFSAGYAGGSYSYTPDFLKSLTGFEYIDLDTVLHPYTTAPTAVSAPVDNTEFKKKCAVLLQDRLEGVYGVINDMMKTLK